MYNSYSAGDAADIPEWFRRWNAGADNLLSIGPRHQPWPLNGQIPYASFGDSFSNMAGIAGHDIKQATAATSFPIERMGSWITGLSGGICRPVANCGVSGDTTTQMLARDGAGSSSTRKAITDAANLGARFIVNHFGINDIQGLAGGALSSTIAAVVTQTVTNSVRLLKREVAAGLYPITVSLVGYTLNTATAAEIATRRIAVASYNQQMEQIIADAGGLLGSWIDAFRLVATPDGGWQPGMDDGLGLHPGANACATMYPPVVAEMLRLSGLAEAPFFGYGQFPNLSTNSDFSAASSGVATNFTIAVGAGTGALANSLVDFRGQTWQQTIFTPATFDGNGNAIVVLTWALPNSSILLNDVLGAEISLIIDSPNGGPAQAFHYLNRFRSNTAYTELPWINPTIAPKVPFQVPIDVRQAFPPIISPAATPATFHIITQVATTTTAPVRIRHARPRAFKLPTAY